MSKFFISKCHKNITLCFELIYINITEYIRYESQNTLIMLLLAPVSPTSDKGALAFEFTLMSFSIIFFEYSSLDITGNSGNQVNEKQQIFS